MNLQKGQKILIHGGAGGIGSIAIQIAKYIGAYVATTVSTNDKEFVKALRADKIIDYKTEHFQDLLTDFDAVYDTIGGKTQEDSFKVLKKGGILLSMKGKPSEDLAKQYGVTVIGQGTHTNTAHLTRLAELIDKNIVSPKVDKIFPLSQIKEAFDYQTKGSPRGKVVLDISK
jgi:NADPH:quinone reductase-like Zn-dependent oxidoreductase